MTTTLLCVFPTQSSISGIRTRGSDSSWRDALNRTRLWHGTNYVEKSSSNGYYPHELTDDAVAENIATMKSMGFNVVRLGVMMGGTLPTPDGIVNRYVKPPYFSFFYTTSI